MLLGKSVEELADLAVSFGQPRYRGQQLLDGILQGAKSMDDVKTVSHPAVEGYVSRSCQMPPPQTLPSGVICWRRIGFMHVYVCDNFQ